MAAQGFLLIASFLLILLVLAKPLGSGLARLIAAVPLPGVAGIERILWRTLGITDHEMNWRQYLLALLTLNLLGLGILFCLLFWQEWLPLNPQRLPGLSWDLALNTAVSFVTNTNWQAYSGESTLSYFSQMAGLTVQNFLSAATGIAVVFALIRAFTRQNVHTLGNAWQDLVRITLWILFPVALIIALFFIQQGVPQNLSAYQPITTLEGAKQLLPMGPVASQEAIKMLGTNGGGFFNANSSHPFENPTALTNLAQMLAIFLIPAALCFAFGEAAGNRRQGRALLWAMSFIFVVCVAVVMWAEVQGNPHLLAAGADSSVNMEGKETRFGVLASSLFAVVTTAASCGAVKCHARLVYRSGRYGADVADANWRSGLWRRRFRAVRHVAVCPAGGVYRGADDRSHTGISGEKNRRARNENDRAGDSGHADAGLVGFGAGDDDGCRTQRNAEPWPARF